MFCIKRKYIYQRPLCHPDLVSLPMFFLYLKLAYKDQILLFMEKGSAYSQFIFLCVVFGVFCILHIHKTRHGFSHMCKECYFELSLFVNMLFAVVSLELNPYEQQELPVYLQKVLQIVKDLKKQN